MGVNTRLFNPKKKKVKNSTNILGVGRLITWKGFEFLVNAFAKLIKDYPKAQLLLVGDGPEKNNLKKLAAKNNLKIGESIIFYGPCDRKTLAQIYSLSDLFVSPSIYDKKTGEREAQGLVIAEALASGIPVVATDTGGIPDMIENNFTGLLAREKDPQDLYKKMKELLSNKALQKRCILNGLKLIRKNYSQNIITRKYLRTYHQLGFATTV
jgi:glycosyltransferase involved in cell wall biosynthesis